MKIATSSYPSFEAFVFRKHRTIIWLGTIYLLIQFIIFKSLYPFASFIPDSYGYLEAAETNAGIHVWPIGYSKFLQFLHAFTTSDTALVFVQYILLEAAALYLTFTLLYIMNSGKLVAYTLLLFFVVNPLLLWISNYVSSDALFTILSLVWIVQLLWILHRPRQYHIWLQALVLILAFTVRYNALYYPFIAIAVTLAARISFVLKAKNIGISILLIVAFIWYNCDKYKEMTGEREFSAFSGWQIASNALFMYSRLQNDDNPPPQFNVLHQITLKHIDSLRRLRNRPDSLLGVYYLWNKKAPLQQYMENKWGQGINSAKNFKEWASMCKFYTAYGTYLIQKHPLSYAKYYLWPNVINYYIPPIEILDHYNIEGDHVRPLAQSWFKYPDNQVRGFTKEIKILRWHPILVTLANCIFLYSAIMLIAFGKLKQANYSFKTTFFLIIGVWLSNFSFSILASPIVLRYQLFSMMLFFSYGIILLEYIVKNGDSSEN